MCNVAFRRRELAKFQEDWGQTGVPLVFPEGLPNFAPLDSIRITDRIEILRPAAGSPGAVEMVTRRWSWPGPAGKPVFNYRSDGRDFANQPLGGRCLIPIDGFYEFSPDPDRGKTKAKYAFSAIDGAGLTIAGLWRADRQVGEAWTMLTCPPGADIAPYHDRQIVLVPQAARGPWLSGTVPAAAICIPSPPGSLRVDRIR